MRIVNTFISDGGPIPDYIETCLIQARHTNKTVCIDFICKESQDFFADLNINWIPQDSLSNGNILKKFNSVCDFKRHNTPQTTHPSPKFFWHRTAERIFYLEEYMSMWALEDVFHFENDVLIYYSLSEVTTSSQIQVTDMSDTQTTFAFCYIPKHSLLTELCNYFNELLASGEFKLAHFGYDHISEMSLLNMAYRNRMVVTFPTLQNTDHPIVEKNFIYDPGSYGQYFGGTNNGHAEGFTDSKHYIGEAIQGGLLKPTFENGLPQTQFNKIFNLHIHSKNLGKFLPV